MIKEKIDKNEILLYNLNEVIMQSRYSSYKFSAHEWKEYIEHLEVFYRQLSFEERENLFKDQKFKQFICDNISKPKYGSFLSFLAYDEALTFVDEEFSKMMKVKNNTEFNYFYAFVNQDALEEILLRDFGYDLINCESLAKNMNNKWDIKLKVRIIACALAENVDDNVLSGIVGNSYYQPYDISQDFDYSVNYKEIYLISSFLKKEETRQRFFQSLSLLKALSPENRAELYKEYAFEDLTRKDKKNLVQLLSGGYETKLPDEILFDEEFIEYIANIENDNEYRLAKLIIKGQSELAYVKLENSKNQYVKEYENKILNSSFDNIEEFDVSLEEMVKGIFYKYFKSSLRDACLKAGVIKDAMNSFPEFESKFSQDGIFLVDKMLQLVQTQKDVELTRKQMYANNKFVEFTNENYYILQDIIEVLKKHDDWEVLFDKAISKAKNYFAQDMNGNLYQPKEDNLMQNDDGLKIYDVSKNKRFHILVHRTSVYYDEQQYKFPQIEDEKYLNTSMSIINNNHLSTYGSDKLKERDVVFGYSQVEEAEVVHALPTDSFTNLRDDKKKSSTNKKWQRVESNSAPTYIRLSDFMANMSREKTINEIKLHIKPNSIDKYGRNFVKPNYIVCFNEIRDIDKNLARKHNLPIVFINESEVTKFAEKDYYKPILYKSNSSISGAFEFDNQYIEQ